MTMYNEFCDPREQKPERQPRNLVRDQLTEYMSREICSSTTEGRVNAHCVTDNNLTTFSTPLDGPYFRARLSNCHVQQGNPAPGESQIRAALGVKQAEILAQQQHSYIPVNIRYAWNDNQSVPIRKFDQDGNVLAERAWYPTYCVSLDTRKGEHVAITENFWQVQPTKAVFQYDFKTQRTIPEPVQPKGDPEDEIQPFRELVNFDHPKYEEAWTNVLNFMLGAMRGPKNSVYRAYPILNLMGPGKSIIAKLITMLLDPTETPVHGLPTTERKLHGIASNHHVVTIEDAGKINLQKSRYLSRLSTGTASQHKDIDGTISRPIILTTDDETETKHLADKVIDVELPPIDDDIDPEELGRRLEEMRPKVFGALLSLQVKYFHKLPPVKPNRKTKKQKIERTVTEFLKEKGGSWEGTAGELAKQAFQGELSPESVGRLITQMESIEVTPGKRTNSRRPMRLELIQQDE